MKLRTLVVTVAALAVLAAIVAFVQRPAAPKVADARLGQPIVDRATVERAAKFNLSDGGKSVALARAADGTWRVASYFDFPADFQKLSRFIDDLAGAKLDRLVTRNPERIARLEFKDTKLSLADSVGQPLWSVTLGKNAETGGRFVRFGDENKAYLATLNAWLDTDSKNWAEAQLVHLKPEDVAKIELTFPDANPVTVTRAKKEDAWAAANAPAGQRLKPEQISSLLSSLTSLRFSNTTEPGDASAVAAKAHERIAKLTTFDGKTLTIALGRKPEEKKLKPPTPTADGKSGPAALGSVADLARKPEPAAEPQTGAPASEPAKPAAPEFETIPAGPVFATVASSDPAAPINALMQKRAFEVSDYVFTSLPKSPADLFEPAPAAAPASVQPPSTAPSPGPAPQPPATTK